MSHGGGALQERGRAWQVGRAHDGGALRLQEGVLRVYIHNIILEWDRILAANRKKALKQDRYSFRRLSFLTDHSLKFGPLLYFSCVFTC